VGLGRRAGHYGLPAATGLGFALAQFVERRKGLREHPGRVALDDAAKNAICALQTAELQDLLVDPPGLRGRGAANHDQRAQASSGWL
jgi:hypothetical protein